MSRSPEGTADAASAFLAKARREVDACLDRILPPAQGPCARLAEAMRYSVFAGGKRLRPALAMASSRAVGGDEADATVFGAALELLHTYSLIHDDLPAMDDDDLRRGRPTSHRVFGEGLAILAGDGLHTLAFQVLMEETPAPDVARDLAAELARAAGFAGMVGGQVEDLAATDARLDPERLERIQGRKTAALIRAACRGGGRAGGGDPAALEALGRYGWHLGLAFQMVDDVLDETGTAATLGKTPGKDRREHRPTWVALEGVEATLRRAEGEAARAVEALAGLRDPVLLEALARFVTRRDR